MTLNGMRLPLRNFVEMRKNKKFGFVLGSSSVCVGFGLGSSSVCVGFGYDLFGSVLVLAHSLLSGSGSVRFLAKPGFWFGSLLLGSGSFPSLEFCALTSVLNKLCGLLHLQVVT